MNLQLIRDRGESAVILGELLMDNCHICYTLESKALAIPEGTYAITLYHSPRFGQIVPLLHDVPGRSLIEIHPGNSLADTHGCILVGTEKSDDRVLDSRKAFNHLMENLTSTTEPISITISSVQAS